MSGSVAMVSALVAVVAIGAAVEIAVGQPPVYQRRSSAVDGAHWHGGYARGHAARRDFRQTGPQVSAGSFQRPYPYHLDYYRMRYGGSYAPYFGNLYGPPNVVLAQPYYGDYGYGYGGYAPNVRGYGYPPPGYPLGGEAGGAVMGPAVEYPAGPATDASQLPQVEP